MNRGKRESLYPICVSAEKEEKCGVGAEELLIEEDQRVGRNFRERERSGVCISLLSAVKVNI